MFFYCLGLKIGGENNRSWCNQAKPLPEEMLMFPAAIPALIASLANEPPPSLPPASLCFSFCSRLPYCRTFCLLATNCVSSSSESKIDKNLSKYIADFNYKVICLKPA